MTLGSHICIGCLFCTTSMRVSSASSKFDVISFHAGIKVFGLPAWKTSRLLTVITFLESFWPISATFPLPCSFDIGGGAFPYLKARWKRCVALNCVCHQVLCVLYFCNSCYHVFARVAFKIAAKFPSHLSCLSEVFELFWKGGVVAKQGISEWHWAWT